MPDEFIEMMNYIKSLKFEDKPDYCFIRKLFKEISVKYNI